MAPVHFMDGDIEALQSTQPLRSHHLWGQSWDQGPGVPAFPATPSPLTCLCSGCHRPLGSQAPLPESLLFCLLPQDLSCGRLLVFPVADLFLVGVGEEEEEEEMGEMEGAEGTRRNGLRMAGGQHLSGPSSAMPCSQPISPAPDTYTVEGSGKTRTLPFWMRTPCH